MVVKRAATNVPAAPHPTILYAFVMRHVIPIVVCWLALSSFAHSAEPEAGLYTAYLEAKDGARIAVAQITLVPDGRYGLEMAHAPFTDHFLSMRPFRCLEGPDKHWCHVPYPYEIKRQVTSTDLTDLEYDFLFLWKGAGDYGINMWNGLYYKLALEDEAIVGRVHQIDMDLLSAPPEQGNLRPVGEFDIEEADPDGFWLPRLIIEK